MLPNEEEIRQNSEQVIQIIRLHAYCRFSKLQSLCGLKNTRLCMALIYLLQYNRIRQEWSKDGIYYCIV